MGAMTGSKIGICNTVVGAWAMTYSPFGARNIAIGAYALRCTGCGSCSQHNIALGYYAGACYNGGCHLYGSYNIMVGISAKAGTNGGCFQYVIGPYANANGNHSLTLGASSTTMQYFCGCMVKNAGSFRITHPNPKKKGKWLYHSFIESPTAGDNIYRWSFNVCNCEHSFKLPDYHKYLNDNSMAWVYPADHFGEGHAKLDDTKENLIIKTNKDGCYNVLLIGTRCDDVALRDWKGIERDMEENEIKGNYHEDGRIRSTLGNAK